MRKIDEYSDSELMKIAGEQSQDLSGYSDNDLMEIAKGGTQNFTKKQKGYTLGEAVTAAPKNFMSSLYRNTIQPIIEHPIDTVKGLATLTGDPILQKLGIAGSDEQMVSAYKGILDDYLKYGDMDELKKRIAEDPARVMQDISMVAGLASKLPKMGALATVSKVTEPTQIVTAPLTAASKLAKPGKWGESLYQRALKAVGSDTADPSYGREMAKYGLKQEASIRFGTWDKIGGKIKDLKNQVSQVIDQGTMSGDTVPLATVLDKFDNYVAETSKYMDKPLTYQKQALNIRKQLEGNWDNISGGIVDPKDLQALKVKWNDLADKAWGEFNPSIKAALDADLAKSARATLESMYPELKDLNIPMGEMIEFNRHLGKAVGAFERRDLVTNIAFLLKAVVDQPYLKSKLAIWLNKANKAPVFNPKSLERNLKFRLANIGAETGGGGGF